MYFLTVKMWVLGCKYQGCRTRGGASAKEIVMNQRYGPQGRTVSSAKFYSGYFGAVASFNIAISPNLFFGKPVTLISGAATA